MNTLLITISIICFLFSLFFLIGEITAPLLVKILTKIIAILGVMLPMIYWLKLLNII